MYSFLGNGSHNIELATHNGKVYIPKPLHNNVIYWFHTYFMHHGANRTEETIKQHLYWPGLQREVQSTITKIDTFLLS